MNNLSFHITDISANSIRAGASEVCLDIRQTSDAITLRIADNGSGMDRETMARVANPFYTTRTTRKVGLGLPFLIQNAEQTGGRVMLRSEPGKGTEVTAEFKASHIDCPPWGDLPGTVALLITGTPGVNIRFTYRKGEGIFALSTAELKEAAGEMPLSHPRVAAWVKEMIQENINGM